MLVCPVAPVNDGHAARGGKLTHRTFGGMAHNDGVRVTAQYPRRVIKRFAFSYGGTLKTRGFADMTTQKIEGTAKTDTGSGGWFKEHRA